MKIHEITNEAFGHNNLGGVDLSKDYSSVKKSKSEIIGSAVKTLGILLGSVAGFKYSDAGFMVTTAGIVVGMLGGAIPGKLIIGDKPDLRQSELIEKAKNIIRTTDVSNDLDQFRDNMFNSTPKIILDFGDYLLRFNYGMDTSAADDDEDGVIFTTHIPGDEEAKVMRRLQSTLDTWFGQFEAEWSKIASKYQISSVVLGQVYIFVYGKSIILDWLDTIKSRMLK